MRAGFLQYLLLMLSYNVDAEFNMCTFESVEHQLSKSQINRNLLFFTELSVLTLSFLLSLKSYFLDFYSFFANSLSTFCFFIIFSVFILLYYFSLFHFISFFSIVSFISLHFQTSLSLAIPIILVWDLNAGLVISKNTRNIQIIIIYKIKVQILGTLF